MPPEFETRLKDVEDRVAQLGLQRLSYPMDSTSKKIIQNISSEFFGDLLFATIFNKVFYHEDHFLSLDRVQSSADGTGSTTLDVNVGIYLTTGTVSGNGVHSRMGSNANADGNISLLSFNKKSSFRCQAAVESVGNCTGFIWACTTSARPDLSNGDGYGFKIVNGAISGASYNNGSETLVSLGYTLVDTELAKLEANFDPIKNTISFLVNDVMRGVLSTGLPRKSSTPQNIWFFRLVTNTGASRIMYVNWFEYIQERFNVSLS